MTKDIFEYVVTEESSFQLPIEPIEGWKWGFKDHLRKAALYKNSQFDEDNTNRKFRPYRNIILPLLNIQYRLTGFDVKDIDIYVTNPDSYHKSFILKKYHEKWARENEIDTLIDKLVESYVDYGGALVKNGKKLEVVDLQTIAFCNQSDLLQGAFAIKHFYTPDELRKEKAWDQAAIQKAIIESDNSRQQDKERQETKTTSKTIEIYEVHGIFPDSYLSGDYVEKDDETYSNQIHILSFYEDKDGKQHGISYFKKKEPELPFKYVARDGGVFGRALGRGGIEELIEPQVWTNFAEICMARLLDATSKVIFKTTDTQFKSRNVIDNLDNWSVLSLQTGTDLTQVDSTPRSFQLFRQEADVMKDNADRIAAAGDALQGEQPKSGTPFALQELVVMENKGMHHFRRGQIASFIDEIYRDWVLPRLAREVTDEKVFLSILSADELQEIAEKVTNNQVNNRLKRIILSGRLASQTVIDSFRETFFRDFVRSGNRRFLKILKKEMEDEELDVATSIAGKQKNLPLVTEKLVSLARQLLATPQMKQDPEIIKMINAILESSGLSPITYGLSPYLPTAQSGGGTEPLRQLGEVGKQENANV